jgi:hypothetical protein
VDDVENEKERTTIEERDGTRIECTIEYRVDAVYRKLDGDYISYDIKDPLLRRNPMDIVKEKDIEIADLENDNDRLRETLRYVRTLWNLGSVYEQEFDDAMDALRDEDFEPVARETGQIVDVVTPQGADKVVVDIPEYEMRLEANIPPNLRRTSAKACASYCRWFHRMTICTGFGAPLEGTCRKYPLAGIVTEYTVCDAYEGD